MDSRFFGASRSGRTRDYSLVTLSLALIAVGFLCCPTASAGLIIDSVKYDGQVKSGATTGVESHFTTANFPPPNTNHPLPAVAPFPPAPLNAPNNLSMTYTVTNELFNGALWKTGIVTISNPTAGGNVFANTLDNTLALPVQLDMYVFSDTELAANEKLLISGVGIENNNIPPFPIATSEVISNNRGTAADPIRIQLGMPASTVNGFRNGFVKLHIHWGTGAYEIPEPSSLALILLAVVGLLGGVGRQRSA